MAGFESDAAYQLSAAVPPPRGGELAESGETYLETLLMMKERREGGLVRAVDLANELGFSKPSVSRAIGVLKEKGLIRIGDNGDLEFTAAGLERAREVLLRHQQLTSFLHHVAGVSVEVAEKDACRIEHVISNETMEGIRRYLKAGRLL